MRYFIAGGGGFIGSHVAAQLLREAKSDVRVTVFDNWSSGRPWHLAGVTGRDRLSLVTGDLKDLAALTAAMAEHDHVFHFASNPDIAKAATQPNIDFYEGTLLTQNILEAMRVAGPRRLTYASGSGVYGEAGDTPLKEDHAPMLPISTYGASKLAGEALICAYSHMFGIGAAAFRFANVVGPRQTHGVAFDFVRRLRADPTMLHILGDGTQSKSYIHVSDVIDAMLFVDAHHCGGFEYYNVATLDYLTVTQIADQVVRRLGLHNVRFTYAGGDRGWKGDIPIVRFDSSKLRSRGWSNRRTSVEAMADAIDAIITDVDAGRI